MKVTLHEDMIISVGIGPVEVGRLPRGVGLERLRWDGEKIVDLAAVNRIWVRVENGVMTLHAVAVPGAVEIAMTWADRRRLVIRDGQIVLLTPEEHDANEAAIAADQADNRNLKAQAAELVEGLTYDRVIEHIDTVFGNLSAAQKTSLKKLYCAVLYLAKNQIRRTT